MRPKIVILCLIAAVGIVALAAIIKGAVDKRGTKGTADNVGDGGQHAVSNVTASPSKPNTNSAVLTQELRATEIEKQLDEINGIIVDGQENPAGTSILVGKVTHPEAVVRAAALNAIMALNDTNAISRLQEAQQIVEDPREKTAIMDLIAYLQLPETMPDVPPTNIVDTADSADASKLPPLKRPETTRQQRAAAAAAARRSQRQGALPGQPRVPQQVAPAANSGQTQETAPAP